MSHSLDRGEAEDGFGIERSLPTRLSADGLGSEDGLRSRPSIPTLPSEDGLDSQPSLPTLPSEDGLGSQGGLDSLALAGDADEACADEDRADDTTFSPPRAGRDGRPLRVVLCPVNTAGVPWTTAEALRRRGVAAKLVVFERYALHPEADVSLDRSGGLARRQAAQWRALAELLPQTDIFHFFFGLTLVPQSLQFPLLRLWRRKSVMHYLGSDIRGKTPEQLASGKKAGAEIVGSYDAIRWVPGAEVIPPGIDLSRVAPAPPSDRARPLILHAPSSRRRKGTEHVIAAVEGLDADLEIVEGLHHDEAFERFRRADIVVDQLNAGWYGLFAIECMALAKPVVTFLHDEAVRRTEDAFGTTVPIVSATAETLRERLRPLVADAEERRRRGAASRAYVELVHDQERITDRLLDVYARL